MKDDCEDVFHLRLQSHGCIFQGGMVPCVHADTCTNAYTYRDTDACMHGCTHEALAEVTEP